MFQDTEDHGFPAAFALLPSFKPVYTLDRAFDVQPYASDTWAMPSLDLRYTGDGWTLVSSSSYFYRHTKDVEYSTYGTQQILGGYYGVTGLPAQPYTWEGERHHNQLTEELRWAFDPIHGLSGTVGAFYSRTRNKVVGTPTYANGLVAATADNAVVGPWPNDLLWSDTIGLIQEDYSIFGELYYRLSERWNLTLGARQYWLKQAADYTADGFINFGPTPDVPVNNRESGLSPKVALSYQATDDVMVYSSASKGFRAGGAQTFAPFCAEPDLPVTAPTHLKSDTLWSYEIGTKVQVPDPGLLITAAAFHIKWNNLQQQVALPCGSYLHHQRRRTRSVRPRAEVVATAPGPGLRKDREHQSRCVRHRRRDSWNAYSWSAGMERLLGGVYTKPIGHGLDGFLSVDYSFTGDSISLLNSGGGTFATRPAYSLVNLRLGIEHRRHAGVPQHQESDERQPNLGDIGYNGYAQYAGDGNVMPMVATLQPLTVMLQYQKNF